MVEIAGFEIYGEHETPSPDGIVLPPHPGVYGFWQEATRLCLEAMRDEGLEGKTVFDLGTGTGILAVAAHRLGASRVYVSEYDQDVRAVAMRTFELNGMTVTWMLDDMYPVADVTVANIGADHVQDLMHRIRSPRVITVKDDGELVILNGA